MKLLIFYASYIYFPFLIACLWAAWRGGVKTCVFVALLLIGPSLLAWARFVEPQMLQVHEETIVLPGASETSPSIRIALFGDPHYGTFSNAMPMKRIVKRINAQDVDAVFIAGDLTYHPKPEAIEGHLAALKQADAPVFAVLGNHDVGFPGPDLMSPVLAAFAAANVTSLENRALEVEIGGQAVIVSGSSDLWQRRQDFSFKANLPEGVPVLLLTHNPDTALNVPGDFEYDLMLAGHTHGGQIRLPSRRFLTRIIPTQYPFDRELHVYPSSGGDRLVYVTTGTGMVGLPMRFNMMPRVDVLTVHVPE